MSINMKPLGSRVIIEPLEEEDRTAFGIILPETAKEKPQKGTIVAVGPGRRLDSGEREALSVRVGDTVLFGKYAGTNFKIMDRDHLILSEDEVLAIVI